MNANQGKDEAKTEASRDGGILRTSDRLCTNQIDHPQIDHDLDHSVPHLPSWEVVQDRHK